MLFPRVRYGCDFRVHGAKRAYPVTVFGHEHRADIGSDIRRPDNQRIVAEPVIGRRIRDDKQVVLPDGVVTKSDVPGCFGGIHPEMRFEPLALTVDQRYQRNRCLADVADHTGDAVEFLFRRGVEDGISI